MASAVEQRILRFVRQHLERHGYSPSVSEIAAGIGHRSKGSTHRYIRQLVEKGSLIRQSGEARGLSLPPAAIPLQGRIAAGEPIEAVPESERVDFFERFNTPGLYQLQIRGDSLKDAGIHEGDIVLIKPATKAAKGQIVVALIDGADVTLKRYYPTREYVELRAENPDYPPQRYAHDRVRIQGVLHSVHKFRL